MAYLVPVPVWPSGGRVAPALRRIVRFPMSVYRPPLPAAGSDSTLGHVVTENVGVRIIRVERPALGGQPLQARRVATLLPRCIPTAVASATEAANHYSKAQVVRRAVSIELRYKSRASALQRAGSVKDAFSMTEAELALSSGAIPSEPAAAKFQFGKNASDDRAGSTSPWILVHRSSSAS